MPNVVKTISAHLTTLKGSVDQMKIYVFGNEYVAEDKRAIEVAKELEGAIGGISFGLCP
jgi:hypothetical protein